MKEYINSPATIVFSIIVYYPCKQILNEIKINYIVKIEWPRNSNKKIIIHIKLNMISEVLIREIKNVRSERADTSTGK